MSDKKFDNPYLKGTHPNMDYMDILKEYREKNNKDTDVPDTPYKKKSNMELDRSALLDPMDVPEDGQKQNRFAFDLKRDVLGEVNIEDIRTISRVSYSDSYRPRKLDTDTRRNYSELADSEGVSSADVRRVIGERRRKAINHHSSPVKGPKETIEEKRARIAKLLPNSQEQRELERLADNQKTVYATPSFMQDEMVLKEEPGLNDTDIVTSLRSNVDIPGFTYRERYMHQGLEEYRNESIPKTVKPIGFGGDGGDIPEFETESSNWSTRPDEERFTSPDNDFNYGAVPMEQLTDKRNVRRAKVRVGERKIAAAFQAGAGAAAVQGEERQKRAMELAAKKRRIERRVSRARGEEDVQLPDSFSDINAIGREAVEDARAAGMESGREFAEKVPAQGSNRRAFVAFDAENMSFEDSQSPKYSSLAPTQNTFTDGDFDKNRSGQGVINRNKSTYSYLFDENAEMPDNVTDISKNGNGSSDYSYLFVSDEDIDNQINAAKEKQKGKAVYGEPIGLSENKGSFKSLNSAVKDQVEMLPDSDGDESAELPENFEPVTHMTLKKGNINFKPLGGVPSVRKKGRIVETAISEKYIPENPDAVNMPEPVMYSEGFSGVSPVPGEALGVNINGSNDVPQNSEVPSDGQAIATGFSSDYDFPNEPNISLNEPNISFNEPAAAAMGGSNVISFEDAVAYNNEINASSDEEEENFGGKREELFNKVQSVIFSMGTTAVALLLLFVLELLPQIGVNLPDALMPQSAPVVYYGANIILLILCIIFCRDIVFGGFNGIFSGRPTYKSFATVAAFSVTAHTVSSFIGAITGGEAKRVYVTSFLLALVIIKAGELFKAMRIGKGLTFISSDRKRGALMVAGVQDGANSINAACNYNDGSIIAYHVGTMELMDYFRYANEEDLSEHISSKSFYYILSGCAICSIINAIVSKSIYGLFAAFSLCSIISMPFTAELSNNLPLSNLSKKLLRRGAMISGWSAVSEFSDTNTVVLDSEDIFPPDTVELMGIKTFGDKRIDRAILDAAAVTISMGGTLGTVFSKLIAGNTEILSSVDSPMYEDGYGISGWTKGRRIIIGNKAMLELYGVEAPVRDYEAMYAEEGSKVIYLSANGELAAMFILKYHTDERIKENLRRFAECGITVAVKSCDINVTPELISRTFGIHPELVKILPWSLSPVVDMLIADEKKSVPAVAATNRSMSAMATVLSAVKKIKSGLVIAVVLQTVAALVGLILGLFLSFTGTCGDFSPVKTVLYCLFWAFVVILIPNIKKVIK